MSALGAGWERRSTHVLSEVVLDHRSTKALLALVVRREGRQGERGLNHVGVIKNVLAMESFVKQDLGNPI